MLEETVLLQNCGLFPASETIAGQGTGYSLATEPLIPFLPACLGIGTQFFAACLGQEQRRDKNQRIGERSEDADRQA